MASRCAGITAKGTQCLSSAHPECIPYCRTHARAVARSAAVAESEAAYKSSLSSIRAELGIVSNAEHVARQNALLRKAAEEMAAAPKISVAAPAAAPAFPFEVVSAFRILGLMPTTDKELARMRYIEILREPSIRAVHTASASSANRMRFERIHAAYEFLKARGYSR